MKVRYCHGGILLDLRVGTFLEEEVNLRVTHGVKLWLNGKCIVDFLLVIIELFR